MRRWIWVLALTAGLAIADEPEAHLGKGYDALKQSRYEEAVAEFREALRLDPKLTMRARFPLAVALFEMKQTAAARPEFEAVRREAGDHPNVLYYLGRIDLLDRNYPSAIQNLQKAVLKPPFPDTAYHLGFAYLKQGNLPAAEKWLKAAARLTPRDSAVQYQLALVYRKLGREDEARKAFDLSSQLRRRDSDDSQIKLECTQKLDQGLRDEARELCQRLYDPNDAEKLTALGLLYGQHGDLEAALEPLQRAAALAPQAPQMQYNLAFTYFRMNRFEDAKKPIAAAVERWPDIFQLNSLYGKVLFKLGEDAAAYQALRRAHVLNMQDPGTAEFLFGVTLGLATKSYNAGQYPETLRYLDEAVALHPDRADPHRAKAEVYEKMGRDAEAAAEREQAERLRQPR